MVGLKLAKLPDRTPIKMTISVPPELNSSLVAYAEAYRNTYQVPEKISDLIPAMLESFLASDRAFTKARKDTVEE